MLLMPLLTFVCARVWMCACARYMAETATFKRTKMRGGEVRHSARFISF